MNIRLIKKLDAVIGYMLATLLPEPVRKESSFPVASILIIRPGGIGDAVLLAPAISSVKKAYHQARITILAERRNAGVFSFVPGVDEILCYDQPSDFLHALRGRYDVVIDTEQSHRLSAVVARFALAAVKIGFDTNERRRMFTNQTPYSHDDYEAVSFAHLLKPLGIEAGGVGIEAPFLFAPDAASAKVADLLESLHNGTFVTIFSGASIAERRWGADRFRRVAEMLSIFGIRTVVVGGGEDRQQGAVIAGGGLGLNLAGLTSLPETAAVIQKSSLLLSGDSGVLHIAVGLDIPTVSLFGPGRAKKWAPRGDRHIVINKELPCSPCTIFGTTPPCPNKIRCMSDITVDEVVNAVTMLLTSVGAMPSQCCKRDWIETA
ncbi:MAG: glycosyltransferase family 9 protein [Desulfuromonadaceae bacterium]|nr:glycosyltransferase family 9 protein [Desulfuromonadaceae bacterium]MDD2847007.1 glycosyltransferase family 9 protein [Desulfuromonadaceae bacterium]MDD4129015.1 glycosyltransferase family 9 protein [Desulfuromonadaceae bacterium]